jgi:proteasome lid subunit RPN8/RPN11
MGFPQIKDVTMLAVLEKAMQNDPVEYCGRFLSENEQTADTLASLAVEMARSWFESDDQAEIVMQSTLLSSVMFMTYEMVKAETEAKELEELIG